jgi:hypothetical protein
VAEHNSHLAAIARAARINLHGGRLSAFHQRAIEVLSAGGFLLMRYKPSDFQWPHWERIDRWLQDQGVSCPTRIPLDALPPELAAHLRDSAVAAGREPPAALDVTRKLLLELELRRRTDRRYCYANLAFARLERITFEGPDQFAERADHFLAHPDERDATVRQMRQTVDELFTYDALVTRLLDCVRARLASSPVRPPVPVTS